MAGGGYASTTQGYLSDLWKYDPTNNQWTWIGGDSIVNQATVYGTRGVPAINNNPGGRIGSASWIDASGDIWLFGGQAASDLSTLNDLWRYSPSSGLWTWMKGDNIAGTYGVYGTKGVPADPNTPRSREDAAAWTDNLGNFWVFGGITTHQTSSNSWYSYHLNDLWKYSPSSNQWTWMKGDSVSGGTVFSPHGIQGIASPSNNPGGMSDCISWVDRFGNFWLFGGEGVVDYPYLGGYGGYLDDLWRFDVSTNQWIWVKGDNIPNKKSTYGIQGIAALTNTPGNRKNSYKGWVDGSGNLWFLGGAKFDSGSPCETSTNDLWTIPEIGLYSATTCRWIGVASDVWEDPANWSCGMVPNQYTNVTVMPGTPNQPVIRSFAVCKSLTQTPGATVTVGTGYTITITGP